MRRGDVHEQLARVLIWRKWLLVACIVAVCASVAIFVHWYLYSRPEPDVFQILGMVGGWPPVFAAMVAERRRRLSLLAAGCCPRCAYDLRATPERCPECGMGSEQFRQFATSGRARKLGLRQRIILVSAVGAGHMLLLPAWRTLGGTLGWGSLFAGLNVMNCVFGTVAIIRLVRGRRSAAA